MNETAAPVKNKANLFDWDRAIFPFAKLDSLSGELPVSAGP